MARMTFSAGAHVGVKPCATVARELCVEARRDVYIFVRMRAVVVFCARAIDAFAHAHVLYKLASGDVIVSPSGQCVTHVFYCAHLRDSTVKKMRKWCANENMKQDRISR